MERFIAEIVTIVISENCEKSLVEMTTISDVTIEIIHPSLSMCKQRCSCDQIKPKRQHLTHYFKPGIMGGT